MPSCVRSELELQLGAKARTFIHMLMRRTKSIVGITVNNRGDVFGIRRVRDSRYLCLPGDVVEPEPEWQDVRSSGNTVEYSLECPVVSLDRGTICDIDSDHLLEELRQKNFRSIVDAILGDGEAELHHDFVRGLELDEIAKKIDYERACNRGLYGRQREPSQELLSMTIEDLEQIQSHCNDQVIIQYNLNKARKWVAEVSRDQLYQVFQCFSEDQIFFFEDMEFAVMEMRLEDLKREKLKNEDSQCGTSDITTESYIGDPSHLGESNLSVLRSETSVLMQEYIEERNRQRE